jgi:hypothetical protein
VLTELRHGDAAQSERGRIVAQRDALERARGIAGDERARGSGDHGIHADRLPRHAAGAACH